MRKILYEKDDASMDDNFFLIAAEDDKTYRCNVCSKPIKKHGYVRVSYDMTVSCIECDSRCVGWNKDAISTCVQEYKKHYRKYKLLAIKEKVLDTEDDV